MWAYAVTARAVTASLGQLTGVGGGSIRTVATAGLTAVVEDVDLAEFGEAALRRNLEDLAWLEATARAHHRVIAAVAEQAPVVPIRLASVYSGDAGIAAMLADRVADFQAALSRVSGRKEWGVKAYVAPGSGGECAPAVTADGSDGRESAGAGAAYLQRRRDQLTAQRDFRHNLAASVENIHAQLSRHAAGARLHPPQAPQLTGSTAAMLLNAAYLLDEANGEEFAAAVADLAGQYRAVQLELTGPWPPYSFAGMG